MEAVRTKPRVAIVGIKGLPAKGGVERVVEEVVTRLYSDFQFTIYGFNDYIPAGYQLGNIRLIPVKGLHGKHSRPISLLFNTIAQIALSQPSGYDVIHVHNAESGFSVPFFRMFAKVICTAHGPGYDRADKWNGFERNLLKLNEFPFVKGPHCVTSVKRSLAEYYSSAYNVDCKYVPNGIDVTPQTDDSWLVEFLEANGLKKFQYLLFIAGRIIPTKGAHVFLEALNALQSEIPTLIVGGKGYIKEYDMKLDSMISGMKSVRYHDLIKEKSRVLALIQNCKFLIFPSRIEAMSMVLLEAASLGAPVICSDIEENIEVMGDYSTYFKVDSNKDLAKKLRYAMANEQHLRHQALRLKDFLKANQSWDAVAQTYGDLYLRLFSHG